MRAGSCFVFSYFFRGSTPIFPHVSVSDPSISLASKYHGFLALCVDVIGDVLEKIVTIVSDGSDLRIRNLALQAMKSARSKRMNPLKYSAYLLLTQNLLPYAVIHQQVELRSLSSLLVLQLAQHETSEKIVKVTNELIIRDHLQPLLVKEPFVLAAVLIRKLGRR